MKTGEATSHVDEIQGDNEGLRVLAKKITERISMNNPYLLRKPIISERRCIFRLPKTLKNIQGMSHEPQVVALGPYHHKNRQLQIMEELKWRCFVNFLYETGRGAEYYLQQIYLLEDEIRDCYGEISGLNTNELLQMMVVDGCFILNLFFYLVENDRPSHHPLYSLERVIFWKIYEDLLLLENQIPSVVLNKLYETSGLTYGRYGSLSEIAIDFFSTVLPTPERTNRPDRLKWLHLLDLVRLIFVPQDHKRRGRRLRSITFSKILDLVRLIFVPQDHKKRGRSITFSTISCVTKLLRAGIKINPHMADSFLEVNFNYGVIEMPEIILDRMMCSFLVNCVAFEQCYNRSMHFSMYATFLDYLINTAKDVDYLCDRRVIDNCFGTDAEVARFINKLGKELVIYVEDDIYLLELLGDVDNYYRKRLNWAHWQWTSFKREYFGKP